MTLRYMLDTNICIYVAKQKPLSVLEKFQQMTVGEICMSTITYGELIYGAQKSDNPRKAQHLLEDLISLIPPFPLSPDVGKHYGSIRTQLEKKGKSIGNNDLWIAAHAMTLNVVLVSNNTKEFSRVSHLKLENWV